MDIMAKELYKTIMRQMNNDEKVEFRCEACGASIDVSKT